MKNYFFVPFSSQKDKKTGLLSCQQQTNNSLKETTGLVWAKILNSLILPQTCGHGPFGLKVWGFWRTLNNPLRAYRRTERWLVTDSFMLIRTFISNRHTNQPIHRLTSFTAIFFSFKLLFFKSMKFKTSSWLPTFVIHCQNKSFRSSFLSPL